jgi:formyl-CoA transferase
MAKALDGIVVLDLTQYEAGPSCAQMLGWLGADVIKIEPPGGEPGRRMVSENIELDAWFFLMLNGNKKAVTLDLKAPEGRAVLKRMVERADVLIENFGPGSFERLGFGWEDLRRMNPRIISASVKGFGSTGPYASYKSFEMIAQAMGGAMSVTGVADGPPTKVEAGLGDTGAGLHLAIGILAAIVQRQSTGVGQRIEVAQQDAVLNLVRIHLREHYSLGKPVPRRGNRSPGGAPSNMYRCRPFGPNDYVFIHCATLEMWKTFSKILGRPELGDDPTLADRMGRVARNDELDALVEAWTEKRTKHEAMETLGAAGIPCGAVLDSGEVMTDPSLVQRGMIVDLEHPTRGRYPMPGNPVRMSDSPTEVTRAPLLGEHNAEVFGRWLGCSVDELTALQKKKVI